MKHTHKEVCYRQFIVVLTTIMLFSASCKSTSKNELNIKKNDTISHGYNELANPSNLKSIAISDYNTDNPEVTNIERPKKSTVNTKLDTAALFHTWVKDPEGPCADFVISNKSFYIADYDGNGAMPFELIDKQLKIYFNDFIQEGEIISVSSETLKIHWKGMAEITNYVRWTQ